MLTAAWRLLALLPVRPKRVSKLSVDEEKSSALETVQAVIRMVLEPLAQLSKEGMRLTCPDGKIRWGHPILAGWIGDYPEYIKLFSAQFMSCPICVAPKDKMDAHPSLPYTYRSIDTHRMSHYVSVYAENHKLKKPSAVEKKKADYVPPTVQEKAEATAKMTLVEEWFTSQRLKVIDNFLWSIPYVTPRFLWKPDILHTLDLGMVKHSLEWMFNMLDEHDKALGDLFDITWMSISPHQSVTIPNKKYRAVKQWSGKEYRNAAHLMIPVLEATLLAYPSSEEQRQIFEKSLDCLSALVDFFLMANYNSFTFPDGRER